MTQSIQQNFDPSILHAGNYIMLYDELGKCMQCKVYSSMINGEGAKILNFISEKTYTVSYMDGHYNLNIEGLDFPCTIKVTKYVDVIPTGYRVLMFFSKEDALYREDALYISKNLCPSKKVHTFSSKRTARLVKKKIYDLCKTSAEFRIVKVYTKRARFAKP